MSLCPEAVEGHLTRFDQLRAHCSIPPRAACSTHCAVIHSVVVRPLGQATHQWLPLRPAHRRGQGGTHPALAWHGREWPAPIHRPARSRAAKGREGRAWAPS